VVCTEVADVTLDSGLTVREHRLKEYPRRIKIEAELPVIEVIVKQNLWKRIWREVQNRLFILRGNKSICPPPAFYGHKGTQL